MFEVTQKALSQKRWTRILRYQKTNVADFKFLLDKTHEHIELA